MENQNNLLTLIQDYQGIIAALVSVIVGAYLAIRQNTISNRFTERLEKIRHQNTEKIEELKHQLNLARLKQDALNKRTIDILLITWEKMQKARGRIVDISKPLQTIPNLNNYSDDEIESFLNNSTLMDIDKARIREASDKYSTYQKMRLTYSLNEARDVQNEFHNYVILHTFIYPELLLESLNEVDLLFSSALNYIETATHIGKGPSQSDTGRMFDGLNIAYKKANEEAKPIVEEIERLIRSVLYVEG